MEHLVESLAEVQQDINLVPSGKIAHDLMNGDNNLCLARTFAVEAMFVVTQDDDVTECICTLSLSYCTLYVTLSVSLAFSSFVFGCHLIVIILLCMFTCYISTSQKDERARKSRR